eukprot:892695-Rhodomonas_salina.1
MPQEPIPPDDRFVSLSMVSTDNDVVCSLSSPPDSLSNLACGGWVAVLEGRCRLYHGSAIAPLQLRSLARALSSLTRRSARSRRLWTWCGACPRRGAKRQASCSRSLPPLLLASLQGLLR